MLTLYYKPLAKVVLLSDFVVLNTALIFAHYFLFHNSSLNIQAELFFLLSNACWLIISLSNKNYRIMQPMNLNDIIDKFLITLIYQLLIVESVVYFFGVINISKDLIAISFALFFFLILAHRVLLYFFLQRNYPAVTKTSTAIVVGDKHIADSLISAMNKHHQHNYRLNEYIPDEEVKSLRHDVLFDKLLANKPDEIFVCYKDVNIDLLDRLIAIGNKNKIKIKVVFDQLNGRKKRPIKYKSVPIVHVNANSGESPKIKIAKRSFDVVFSCAMLTLGSPIYLLLYATTKLTSKGPVFYKQERIGKDEKPFYIYKFRSMRVDAEKSGPQLARANDPRVTKWGMMMRKTRLDELPQFWNVLKGDMSIVGYRPERKHFIEEISKKTPEYKRLLRSKPGITSLGQVHYGYAENVDQMCERLRYDLLYARNISFNSDVSIILKTVKIMVEGRGK